MSRNFGIGSRDMGRAGQMALDRAATAGGVSFSTAATNADRWNDFTSWAREQGIKRMEDVTPEAVRDYGTKQGQCRQQRDGHGHEGRMAQREPDQGVRHSGALRCP